MPKTTQQELLTVLSVSLDRFEKSYSRAEKVADKRLTAMEKRMDRGMAKLEKSGQRMALSFNKAIASIGVGLAIRKAGQLSDAYTEASNKIKSAEVAFGGSLGSVADLNVIANETRADLTATVDLYTRLARAGGKLGKTQAEIAKTTEIANKAFKASGRTAAEQASAIGQLSQGLESGILAGEELKAIRENAPILGQAIADELDIAFGELKEAGAEGRITAEVVFAAILNGGKKIESQFDATTRTISESFTRLKNNATKFVGTSDSAASSADALSKFILLVANNLDLLADAAVIATAAIGGAKLGLAMANFAGSLQKSSALMKRATARLGALNAASILAARGVGRLNLAFKAIGGPYTLIIGGIALALLSLYKEGKRVAEQEERWAANAERANKVRDRSLKLLKRMSGGQDEVADKTDKAADAVKRLGDEYKTLAQRLKELGDAEIARLIKEEKVENEGRRKDVAEQEKELARIKRESKPGRLGLVNPETIRRIGELEEKIRALNSAIAESDQRLKNLETSDPSKTESVQDEIARVEEAKRRVAKEEELALARARGDKTEIQNLEDQKLLDDKRAEYKGLGFDDYEARAQNFVKSIQQARKAAATNKPPKEDLQADKARLVLVNKLNLARATGNKKAIADLETQLAVAELTAKFEGVGFDEDTARKRATDQVEALENARAKVEEDNKLKALSERQLEIDLHAAAILGDGKGIENLSRELNIRQRMADLKALDSNLTDDQARDLAEQEEAHLEIAGAIAEANYERERQLEFKLLLAREAGNTAEEERLARELDLLRRKNQLIAEGKDPGEADADAEGEQREIDKAHLEGQIRDAAKGAFRAAVDGNFGDYLKDKLSNAADSMFDRAIDSLLDSLFNQVDLGGLFGSGTGKGGGGLGGFFAGLFDSGGNIKRGQFAVVGEKGPEIVQGPADVISRVDTSRLLRNRPDRIALQSGGQSSGEMVFIYNPVIDATGADPAAISRLEKAMARQRQEFVPNIQKYFKEREQGLYK